MNEISSQKVNGTLEVTGALTADAALTVVGAIGKQVVSGTIGKAPVDLYVDTTQRANSGTGVTNLSSYSMAAAVLGTNNQWLEIEAWGTYANNANSKTLNFVFGSTSFSIPTASGVAVKWRITIKIFRTGATTQKVFIDSVRDSGTASEVVTLSTAAETLANALTVKFTGQGGATNDILQEMMTITWHDAP